MYKDDPRIERVIYITNLLHNFNVTWYYRLTRELKDSIESQLLKYDGTAPTETTGAGVKTSDEEHLLHNLQVDFPWDVKVIHDMYFLFELSVLLNDELI